MGVRQTDTGKWAATVRIDGRERQKTFATKAKASAWERSQRTDVQRGEYVDERRGHVTMEQWSRTWLASQGHLAPKTMTKYAGIAANHIVPRWGQRRLGSLTHSEVQEWVSSLTPAYSAAAVRYMHRVLSLMLDLAERDNRVRTNVAAGVKLPRFVRRQHRYLSDHQVDALVDGLDQRDRLIVYVLAYCGLRWGEMAALSVGSFNPLKRRLAVDRAMIEVSGHMMFGLPKDYERREVPVPKFLVEPLVAYCAGRGQEEVLFPTSAGTCLRVGNWRRDVFDQAVIDAGLPQGLTPHELRHTAASLAVKSGANVKAVQAMLGHAKASMTLDVYTDLFPDDLDEVAEAMDTARTQALTNHHRDAGPTPIRRSKQRSKNA
jgi:integrase